MKTVFEQIRSANPYLLFFSIVVFTYLMILAQANGDFKVFLVVGELIKNGKNIYNTWIYTAPEVSNLYYYSPFFAFIMIPFSYLPHYIPNMMWQAAGIYWTFRCWQLIEQRFDISFFSKKEYRIFVFLSFLLVLRALLYNFDLIQMTIFMLWSILESINLFEKNKNFLGSILLALAINIKLLPIVILPYLIYRLRFIPVLYTVLFSIALLYIPGFFIGFEFNNFLHSQWWATINPSQKDHLVETGLGVHSLTALIPTLLMQTEGDLDIKRNILNLAPETVNIIVNSIRVLFIAFTLYFVGLKPRRQITNTQAIWEISYITMIIPLIFPHQQKYAFFLLLPASAYLIYFIFYTHKYTLQNFGKFNWRLIIALTLLSFVLSSLSTDGVIGRHYNKITMHYKTITYGTMFLCLALAICRPQYLTEKQGEKPPA